MAVAKVNEATANPAADPATMSFDCGATADCLVVLALCRNSTPASATFDGQAMTLDAGAQITNGTVTVALFYLFDPPVDAAKTVSVDMSTHGGGNNRLIAVSLSGTDQNTTVVVGESSGTGTAISVSITPGAADGAIICGFSHEGNAIASSRGTGQVALGDADGFFDEGVWDTGASYELNTDTSANAQTFTHTQSDVWAAAALWIGPPSAGGGDVTIVPAEMKARALLSSAATTEAEIRRALEAIATMQSQASVDAPIGRALEAVAKLSGDPGVEAALGGSTLSAVAVLAPNAIAEAAAAGTLQAIGQLAHSEGFVLISGSIAAVAQLSGSLTTDAPMAAPLTATGLMTGSLSAEAQIAHELGARGAATIYAGSEAEIAFTLAAVARLAHSPVTTVIPDIPQSRFDLHDRTSAYDVADKTTKFEVHDRGAWIVLLNI
jgi:hypothetical protein